MKPATLLKTLGAVLYDSFIVISLMFLASAIGLFFTHGHGFMAHQILFMIYLTLFCGLYFTYCWSKSGQTLGMMAWKIQILNHSEQRLSYSQAWQRYLLALLGLGTLGLGVIWRLFDRQQQLLHDRFLKLRLVTKA